MSFERALSHVLSVEGGYSNDPKDSGGATNYGITENQARAVGYRGDMASLPRDTATAVYRRYYWDALHLDYVCSLSWPIALELFDTAVNCGPGRSGQWLQRSLNALNREQKDYPDLTVDGDIGQRTLGALKAFLGGRGLAGEKVLLRALNALQGAHYIDLAERRMKDERFAFGWFLNRVN